MTEVAALAYIRPLSKFPAAIKWIFLRTFFLYGFRLLDRVCQKPHKKNLHKNLLFADYGEFRKRSIQYPSSSDKAGTRVLIIFSEVTLVLGEYEPLNLFGAKKMSHFFQ